MRKLLLLVLTLTASASPLVRDEKLAFRDQPFDHVVKEDGLPVDKIDPIVLLTETEQGSLVPGEPVLDAVQPDSMFLEPEPETEEEHREAEETSVILEEPVLEADYLTVQIPEIELEPEPERDAIQMSRDIAPVEELVEELENVKMNTEMEMGSEREENLFEEPTLESDYIVAEDPEVEMEPVL